MIVLKSLMSQAEPKDPKPDTELCGCVYFLPLIPFKSSAGEHDVPNF